MLITYFVLTYVYVILVFFTSISTTTKINIWKRLKEQNLKVNTIKYKVLMFKFVLKKGSIFESRNIEKLKYVHERKKMKAITFGD